jgi:bla regulator protein blaR1
MMRIVRTFSMVGLIGCSLYAQSSAPRPTFEVASIKIKAPSEAGPADLAPRRSGDRVSMHNTQLELMVRYAYHAQRGYPVEGDLNAPESWRWFDIDAVVAGSPTDDELRLMFQTLLEERFKLKVHHQTRQLDVYTLVQEKKKPGLAVWQASGKPISVRGTVVPEGFVGNLSSREDPYHIAGRKVSTVKLASYLSQMLQIPVTDGTGLSGDFDFELIWGSAEGDRPSGPPDPSELGAALREQLGLKLVRAKQPIDVLVVDHFEKPSAN